MIPSPALALRSPAIIRHPPKGPGDRRLRRAVGEVLGLHTTTVLPTAARPAVGAAASTASRSRSPTRVFPYAKQTVRAGGPSPARRPRPGVADAGPSVRNGARADPGPRRPPTRLGPPRGHLPHARCRRCGTADPAHLHDLQPAVPRPFAVQPQAPRPVHPSRVRPRRPDRGHAGASRSLRLRRRRRPQRPSHLQVRGVRGG